MPLIRIIFICSALLLTSNTYAQQSFIAVYEHQETPTDYRAEFILIFDGTTAAYEHHQRTDKIDMNDGSTYTYYLPHEFYTWSITYPSKVVAERKILEDQTPIYFKGQPNPEWEITTETKIIDGYTVQKAICTNSYVPATGDYHLQDAIAWFTMDIPVSVGPERYYGLPGLIVLLEHSGRKTVRTKLKAISFDDIDTVDAVEVPAAAIVVSLEEIVRPYGIDRKWLRDEKKRWKEVSSR